jgi:plastocyanin
VRRRLAVAAAACALGATATGSAADAPTREVTMPGKAYAPSHITVLTGTTVTWRNADATNHTVTADGGAFDSGYVGPGGSFSTTFATQGHFAYHCTIHRFMKGVVDVYTLVLTGPGHPVAAGNTVVLSGLATAGTPSVTLLRLGAKGPGHTVAARADGSFVVRFRATAPGAYRATAGNGSSPVVHVQVVPAVTARRVGSRLRVAASPARPGARVALQVYVPDTFSWRTVARARLDSRSRATLPLPAGRPVRIRAVVRGSDGWADGTTGQIVLAH